MNLHRLIEQHWHQPKWWLTPLLRPLSKLFTHIANVRRQRYLSGRLKNHKLPVPVIVMGNIHVGGTGKTPMTRYLVQQLQQNGIQVGIISRGYGRKNSDTHILNIQSTAEQAGDEPLMLYHQTAAPTAVGSNRYAAGMALLARHPDIQIIIADDGLQHYSLARDVEIAVFPAADIGRNLSVLPHGALREPLNRLHEVDAIIISQATSETNVQPLAQYGKPIFRSQIHIGTPYRLCQPNETLLSGSLKNEIRCVAIAAIARPERFFNALRQLGFDLNETHALPDHAVLDLNNLPRADVLFITEKDAAKLPAHVPEHIWVLPIEAHIIPDLAQWVCTQLQTEILIKSEI